MDIEKVCGIRKYGTDEEGIGGEIKNRHEDFGVEEIPTEFSDGEKFLICELEKLGLSTFQAISEIASKLHISKKRIGYGGIKDSKAVTKQFISLRDVRQNEVGDLSLKNIKLTPVQKSAEGISPGQLNGNKFNIVIRNIDLSEEKIRERLKSLGKGIEENGIPNYFGLQRFGGKRPVSHLVGRKILQRNFKEAVITYLTKSSNREEERVRKSRNRLSEEGNFEEAVSYFPKKLGYERKLLKKIIETGDLEGERNWINILKMLPNRLNRLFVHAYQSYIFNLSLSKLMEQDEKLKNFPARIVGYSTSLSDSGFDKTVDKILEEDGIKPSDFKFKDLGFLSSKGAVRASLLRTEIQVQNIGKDGLNPGRKKVKLEFSLKPGSYATVVLREVTKTT